MKTKKYYFKWGLTVFLTVCAILVFYDVFYKGGTLLGFFNKLTSTLAPVLYGFAMAYLLSPIVNWLERLIRLGWSKWSLTREKTLRRGWLRAVSILITWAIVSYALYLLMSVLVPQLIDSITTLINNAESYYNQIYDWADNLLKKNPNISNWVRLNLERYYQDALSLLTEKILPGAQQMLTSVTGGVISSILGVVVFAKNLIIGIIISVYLLAMKEQSLARCCKLLYGVLSERAANLVMRGTRRTDEIFSGFVRGKLLDSLIIGILCFIGGSILNLPYTPLVSVVVGVTNIIPFFGPFLGAIQPEAVPDLHHLRDRAAAVRRQHPRAEDPRQRHGHLELLGRGHDPARRRLFRRAGYVSGRAGLCMPAGARQAPHRPPPDAAEHADRGLCLRRPRQTASAGDGAGKDGRFPEKRIKNQPGQLSGLIFTMHALYSSPIV